MNLSSVRTTPMRYSGYVLALFFLLTNLLLAEAEVRTWTSDDGATIQAKLIRIEGDSIVIEMNRTEYTIPIERLGREDQRYISDLKRAEELALKEQERKRQEEEEWNKRLNNSLLRNSDFRSSSGWSGDGGRIQIEDEDGENIDVWRVRLSGGRVTMFEQDFRAPSGAMSARATIRYRVSEDFESRRPKPGAISIRFRRSDGGWTFFDRAISDSTDEWKSISVTFGRLDLSRNFKFQVEVFPGNGEIYFRDIILETL